MAIDADGSPLVLSQFRKPDSDAWEFIRAGRRWHELKKEGEQHI